MFASPVHLVLHKVSVLYQIYCSTHTYKASTLSFLVVVNVTMQRDGHYIPYPTAFPYGNGMVLHFYQQQESSTTKTVHKVINKGLKAYV